MAQAYKQHFKHIPISNMDNNIVNNEINNETGNGFPTRRHRRAQGRGKNALFFITVHIFHNSFQRIHLFCILTVAIIPLFLFFAREKGMALKPSPASPPSFQSCDQRISLVVRGGVSEAYPHRSLFNGPGTFMGQGGAVQSRPDGNALPG